MHGWASYQVNILNRGMDVVTNTLASGFVGMLAEWWGALNQESRVHLLRDFYNLTGAIVTEFVGIMFDETARAQRNFMAARLCNMDKFYQYLDKMK